MIKINSGCFEIHAIIIFTLSSFKNAKFRYVKTAIGNTIAIRLSRSFLAQTCRTWERGWWIRDSLTKRSCLIWRRWRRFWTNASTKSTTPPPKRMSAASFGIKPLLTCGLRIFSSRWRSNWRDSNTWECHGGSPDRSPFPPCYFAKNIRIVWVAHLCSTKRLQPQKAPIFGAFSVFSRAFEAFTQTFDWWLIFQSQVESYRRNATVHRKIRVFCRNTDFFISMLRRKQNGRSACKKNLADGKSGQPREMIRSVPLRLIDDFPEHPFKVKSQMRNVHKA